MNHVESLVVAAGAIPVLALALLALALYPLIWLPLPLRIVGVGVEAVFELLRAIVMLPSRILRGHQAGKIAFVQHLTDGAASLD